MLIVSMVSARTGEPGVVLRWGNEEGMLTPRAAREHARRVFEGAEAADQEAFLWRFLKEELEVEPAESVAIMAAFRRWRAGRDPELDPEIEP